MKRFVARILLWALRHVQTPVLLQVRDTVRQQIAEGGKIYWDGDRLAVIGLPKVRLQDGEDARRGEPLPNQSPGSIGRAPHLHEVPRRP